MKQVPHVILAKRLLLATSAVCMAFPLQAQKTEKPAVQPNVILIYLDDMGYGDLGSTGALDYNTPNIDRLSDEGIFFSHYLSPQAVCSASRAGLMTGCYPNRVGFSGALDHRSTRTTCSREVFTI